MANKITQKIGFTWAMETARSLGNDDMAVFFENRLNQLEKQTENKKRSPRQIENDAYKEIILGIMQKGFEYTIDDMLMYFGLPMNFNQQRVSALMSQLGEKGTKQITCIKHNNKMYYALADE